MDDLFQVPTQSEIDVARKKSDKIVSAFSAEQIRTLRHNAKYDKFFLAHGILRFKQMSPVLHNHLAKWLEKMEYEQYKEILLPRSHYKSSLCTITDSIQLALPDDSGGKLYPHNLGPNIRLLLAHNIDKKAQAFLYAIMMHFTTNPLLMGIYPELVPKPGIQKMNLSELGLPRDIIEKEQTFNATGVSGAIQSAHFNYIKADDLYGENERDSPTEREKLLQWIDNMQALLVTMKTDHIDFIGTRWAFDDCFAHIEKNYEGRLKRYVRGAEEIVVDSEGKKEKLPIFPEQFSTESFEILKKNKKVWSAQYANDPSEGSTKWKETWLKYYNRKNLREIVVFDGDDRRTVDIFSLDRILFIDPAPKYNSGIVLTGTDSRSKIYVIEAECPEYNPTLLTNRVFQLVLKYTPRIVVIEDVLFSVVYSHWWTREMALRRIKFKVENAKTGGKSKDIRIDALENYYNTGQIYVNPEHTEFIEEFRQYGAVINVHMHDALAYGPRYWRAAKPLGWNNPLKGIAETSQIASGGRDSEGGYSHIYDEVDK